MGGSLTVVGTGMVAARQLTPEARSAYLRADDAFFLPGDAVSALWLTRLRADAGPLHGLYTEGRPRLEAYEAMVETLLAPVRAGRSVCAAFYGHPGVFVWPAHEAVRRAREEGRAARMLPAVSSLDCLFCDLGLDPGPAGCQIYEATDFLLGAVPPDVHTPLVLLQISVVGESLHRPEPNWSHLPLLVEHLERFYPGTHEVTAYEASPYPGVPPVVERVRLGSLPEAALTAGMTLLVPPVGPRPPDPTVAARLRERD